MDTNSTFGVEPERLERLLSAGLEDSDFEDDDVRTASLELLAQNLGSRMGQYKLLNVCGEGGMGIVYLAEQKHPIRRQVALKVIKPGMDSKRVIARFEAERQALALLDHPNIANVYDAGATELGRPYFVMEYVKGLPITEHCDRHKLMIEERLRLFQQVCLAIQHAHQKGIIHRDIKPSNILVSTQDDKATPKIIDFGVAKALAQPLTERTLATEESQLLGTPEYMSPEQAHMAIEDIDTRSDIYSLGVLLYVLLTGILPFDSETFREGGIEYIRRVICKTDPKTPSTRLMSLGEEAAKIAEKRRTEVGTLAKSLHRELEWIPLKAMRKERAERYRSASELADDIDNYLKGNPLIAGPLTVSYRFKKFVRRNRALVTGIIAVLIMLIAGVVGVGIFAIKAEQRRIEAQMIAEFLENDVLGAVSKARVGEATVKYTLDTASESLEGRFKDKPLIEASIRNTLGLTYRNLTELKLAESHLQRAVQLRQEHLGAEHLETLESIDYLAWVRLDQGRYEDALELLEESLAISRRMFGDEHFRTLGLLNGLGVTYICLGRYHDAEQLHLKAIPATQRVLGKETDLSLFMVGNLGITYEAQGRYVEAERQYFELLRMREGFWDDENVFTLSYKSFLANLYARQKQYEKAERLYLEILPTQRKVDGDMHRRTLRSVNHLAHVYTYLSDYDKAEELFTEAMVGLQRVLGGKHPHTLHCVNGLALLRAKQKRYDEAEHLFTEALEGRRQTLGDDHPDTLESKNDLAILYKEQERDDEAEKLLLEAVEGRRFKLGDTHPHTIESIKNLIDLYETWSKPEEAENWRAELPQTEAVKE